MHLKKKHRKFFEEAKRVSKLATGHWCRVGACLKHKDNIIASACNEQLLNDLTKLYKSEATIHAEINCIIKVPNKNILKHCDIFIYRELRDGSLAMSRPCKFCIRCLKSFGINKIHYTSPEGYHYEELE